MAFNKLLLEERLLPAPREIFGYVVLYAMLDLAFSEEHEASAASKKLFYRQCGRIEKQIQNAFINGLLIMDWEEVSYVEAQLLKHKKTSGLLYNNLLYAFNELSAFSWQSESMPKAQKVKWILALINVQEALRILFLKWHHAAKPPYFAQNPQGFYDTKSSLKPTPLPPTPAMIKTHTQSNNAFLLNNAEQGKPLARAKAKKHSVRLVTNSAPVAKVSWWTALWRCFSFLSFTPAESSPSLSKR